jgi:peroxiredoxin
VGIVWAQAPFAPVPPAREDALRFGAELQAFEVKDIAGRTWKLDDLRGKYTILYVWHTFTARWSDRLDPYAKDVLRRYTVELDEVERVHRQAKGSNNVQVLTLCTDYDYTHAPEYLKGTAYTFPAIADWVLIRKLVPAAGGNEPYFVVSPEGRLSEPFRSWSFSRVFREVQRAAAGGAQ